jgi:hypothetical protein
MREAEGEAAAILAVQKSTADGQSTKIIIPSDLQSLAGMVAGLSEIGKP